MPSKTIAGFPRPRTLFCIACAFLSPALPAQTGAAGVPAQTGTITVNEPVKQAQFPGAFTHTSSYPSVSNGYLISFTRRATSARPIYMKLISLANGTQQTIAVPIAETAFVQDAAVGAQGEILLGGLYQEGASPAHFVAALNSSGSTVFSVNTGAFSPSRICQTSDGSIWVLGQQPGSQSYAMLRRFNAQGNQTGSYFQSRQIPHSVAADSTSPDGPPAFLSCGAQSVGAYIGQPHTSYWDEVTVATGAESFSSVATMPKARVTGLALLAPGKAYATLIHDGGSRDLYALKTQAGAAGSWALVPTSSLSNQGVARILGQDNGSLVYFSVTGAPSQPVLYWSKPVSN